VLRFDPKYMRIDIEEVEGGGDISGNVVQAHDYFYDNAGNLILVNSLGNGLANVVKNPGFETGDLSDWYGSGWTVADLSIYEGEYSLWVFSPEEYSVSQEIPLPEMVSSPITISCWIRVNSWGGGFKLKGVLKGNGINKEDSSDVIISSYSDWTQVSLTIDDIPEGTSSCEIRLIKTSGFAYVFVDNVVCELETEQEISTKYIYAGNRLLAKEEDGDLYFYHLDRLGSPIMITDENGDVVKEKKYEAFGNLVSSSGTYQDNREFTSKEKDPTGFHYFGARYYSGDIGRFLTPDPHTLYPGNLKLSMPQTLNPYVYCHNDPINFLDPNGLLEENTSTWNRWKTFITTWAESWSLIGGSGGAEAMGKTLDTYNKENKQWKEQTGDKEDLRGSYGRDARNRSKKGPSLIEKAKDAAEKVKEFFSPGDKGVEGNEGATQGGDGTNDGNSGVKKKKKSKDDDGLGSTVTTEVTIEESTGDGSSSMADHILDFQSGLGSM